jgi:hypothetical protein
MPYQILLHVNKEYEVKKNNWFYSIYYDIKSIFINPKNDKKTISIQTCNTIDETIYETFYYLVTNKYGGLCFDNFMIDIYSDMYDLPEKLWLEQLYLNYDDNSKDIDKHKYTDLKFIEFLTFQTDSIDDIHHTCLKYCDDSYDLEWNLQFECTE